MAGTAGDDGQEAASSRAPPPPDESVHYLWREPRREAGAAASAAEAAAAPTPDDADPADDAEAAAPSTRPPRQNLHHHTPEFDPWRIEAERERERRERSRRAPWPARSLVRALLWLHSLFAAAACACGAASLLLATAFLLRRLGAPGGESGPLHCYASADPTALTVCEVATGLGALSALAWAGWVAHFLHDAATVGGPPALAVRPRYAQMVLHAVLGLAWGATAAGAVSARSEADRAGMPFGGARAALAGLAPCAALLFLFSAAADAALVFFLSEGHASGALQRAGGIFCVMAVAGKDEAEDGGGGGDGATRGAGRRSGAAAAAAVRRAPPPPGLRFVTWAPGGGGARAPAASALSASSLELF